MKKRIGIIGASGYAGFELLKILTAHDGVDIVVLNSETCDGQYVRDVFPEYTGSLQFTNYTIDEITSMDVDLLFLAREAGYAKQVVRRMSCKIIDLSRDLRFYNGFVYGLPELYRNSINQARVVANPGCYATAAILATYPILQHACVKHIILDCKSGYSGAGRTPSYLNDPGHYENNIIAYRIARHQHIHEITACMTEINCPVAVSFTPHVIPVFRGIMCTAHVLLEDPVTPRTVRRVYQEQYHDESFIKICCDHVPELHDVQGTNMCHIGGFQIDETGQLVIVATIDNLIKGASGQAVQNMNLLFGFPETCSLTL